jgi:predicted RNase H-like HicB family nuclease
MNKIYISKQKKNKPSSSTILNCIIYKDEDRYCGLCLDLDVPSEGETIEDAKNNLIETIKDYIEVALENKSRIINPVPDNDNPLIQNEKSVVEKFKTKINIDLPKIKNRYA